MPHIDGADGWCGAGTGAAAGTAGSCPAGTTVGPGIVAASAGVTTRSVGTGVAAGADASFNEVEDASVVGAGIWTDWKYRVDVGPGGAGVGMGPGVVASRVAGASAAGVGGVLAGPCVAPPQVVAVGPNEAACSVWLRPQCWHVVWPRKTSVAPQWRHVPGCVGGPCVISSPSSIELPV